MGGWSNKELGRQYEMKSAEHASEMAKRIAADIKAALCSKHTKLMKSLG